jgi:dolichol-phosphate mannosyltransferase
MTNQVDLSVIIFAFNEQDNIAPVLSEVRSWLTENEPGAEIVFVDDGSTDDTSAEVEKTLAGMPHQLLRHDVNRGIGAALKTGVRAARGRWVTFLPADGQIAPDAIQVLRDKASREDVDVVFSVYDHRDDGFHRKVLSAGVRGLILLVHGVRMQSDGPYLFRRELFDPEKLAPDTFFLNFEFPIRMLGAGVPSAITTIECRPRHSGHSKSTGWKRIFGVAQDLVDLRVRRMKETFARQG